MEIIQIAVRFPAEMIRAVDETARSGKVSPRWGRKPNRSEIIRLAVKRYLEAEHDDGT